MQRIARGAGTVIALALALMAVSPTLGAWNDREWVQGSGGGEAGVRTLDCTAPTGAFATRGEGKTLGGALLGYDLDNVAQAAGMLVTNNGSRVLYSPAGASAAGADAFANPLNVTALRTLNANLGNGILQLPLDNTTGVIGQYGEAHSTGRSTGASGYVTNTGGIGLKPGNGYPDLATLRLSSLLAQINPGVASALGNVSDVSLKIGAVAGRATVDGCAGTWANDLASTVTRDYLAAALRTQLASPTVGTVAGIANTAVVDLQSAVTGLLSPGALNGIITPLTALLNTALGANGLLSGVIRLKSPNGITVTVEQATVDTTAVTGLITTPLTDSGGVVTVNLSSGTVSVDTAALLAKAYPGSYGNGLNGLAPNTQLLVNSTVLNTLHTVLTQVLTDWVAQVNQRLAQTVDAVNLKVKAAIGLELCVGIAPLCLGGWSNVGTLNATVTGSLAAMRAGTAPVVVDASLLNGGLLGGLLSTLVSALTTPLLNNLGQLVAGVVDGVLGVHRALPATVTPAVAAIVSVTDGVFQAIYGNGIVSLAVNLQNAPNASPTPGPAPPDWSSLPAGRFDVAALRIGVLGALSTNDVRIYLGRGSVGRICVLPSTAACAGY